MCGSKVNKKKNSKMRLLALLSVIFISGCSSDNNTPGAGANLIIASVSATNPDDTDTDVAINRKITATFNKEMDAATITSATFTLVQGTTPVSGIVTYTGTTAVFSPVNNLASNTSFTANLSTGIKDPSGKALEVNKSWSFTTSATTALGPDPLMLGTAKNYVLLAKTGVSTTGTTTVVGDIGLSPSAASSLTGFSETLDATGTFSTAAQVTGNLFAADYSPPSPSKLTTAVLDMQTAYTDAAGRVLPDFTELGAGNIDGLTLVPGLYKWGTGVTVPIGVTLSGGANDIWIFQIAQDLIIGNGAIVTLSGGAQAKNIFWQVAGQVTLGTTSDFKGILLSQTLIALNTGATMNGRAFAQTAITLDANAITAP